MCGRLGGDEFLMVVITRVSVENIELIVNCFPKSSPACRCPFLLTA
jgi:hypothetical protein